MNIPNASLKNQGMVELDLFLSKPTRHNIHWRELRGLLEKIGEVVQRRNGRIQVTRNGHRMSLVSTHGDVGTETLTELHRFIEESAVNQRNHGEWDAPWIAMIDHDEIRIFHPDAPGSIFLRVARNPRNGHNSQAHGRREFANDPGETNRLFETAAIALAAAPEIVFVGNCKGSSNERNAFVAWLQTHNEGLRKRVVASVSSDPKHLTDDQQLAAIRILNQHPDSPHSKGHTATL